MKRILLFIILLIPVCMKGQGKIIFAYDNSGNRVSREILLTTKSLLQSEDEPKFFTEEVAKRIVKIYPNPTYGQLSVGINSLEGMNSGIISIYNFQGKPVLRKKIETDLTDLDISNQSPGVYIMHIEIDSEITTWKVFKR